jgi:(p)ppGpp synthase/HD superfamily hydrolase
MTDTEQHPHGHAQEPRVLGDAGVQAARAMATAAHLGQVDKANAAYIEHPARVVGHLVRPIHEVAAVAWLHDVVEDSPITLEEVEAAFGSVVAAAVDAMTHRPGEPNLDYYARVKANPIALTVKAADLADNTDPARLAMLEPEARARLEAKYAVARGALGIE